MATESEEVERRELQRLFYETTDRMHRERLNAERPTSEPAALDNEPEHPASNTVIDMTLGNETALQKLRRANAGRTTQATTEPPVTEAELGMTFMALAAMSPQAKLAVANRVEAARRRAAAAAKSTR